MATYWTAGMTIRVGEIVRTNYGTGPYRITSVSGLCTCPQHPAWMTDWVEGPPSEPHYHLTCTASDNNPDQSSGDYWLNGYRKDGTSVWGSDRLIFDGLAHGITPDLFAEASAEGGSA